MSEVDLTADDMQRLPDSLAELAKECAGYPAHAPLRS